MSEDEFVPCRPGCQTCSKTSPACCVGAGAFRWPGYGGPYPIGPSVEPYAGPARGWQLHGAWVDETLQPVEGSLTFTPVGEHADSLPVVVAPIRAGKATARLAAIEPKPVPRRPLIAGLIRRLWP